MALIENDNIVKYKQFIPPQPINEIIATYNQTGYIDLLGDNFNVSLVKQMWVDDVEITPTDHYIISSEGEHTIKIIMNDSTFNDCSDMFDDCYSLTSLDVSNFDTSKVTNMRYMFYYCTSLTSLDLSSFNTAKVTDMGGMFCYCKSLTSLDLSSFDTANVTDMGGMFSECSNLTSLDLSSFDTANVTNMNGMFAGCSNLTSLDISNFDISNITTIYNMFYYCSNLTSLDFRNYIKNDLDLSACPSLSIQSINNLIENAASLANGATSRTITLHSTAKTRWENTSQNPRYAEILAMLPSLGITIATHSSGGSD